MILSTTTLGSIVADYGDHHYWGDGWMWLFGTLMMAAVVGLVVVFVWALARGGLFSDGVDRRAGVSDPRASARATLAERYARGEIDRGEYIEKLEDLTLSSGDEHE